MRLGGCPAQEAPGFPPRWSRRGNRKPTASTSTFSSPAQTARGTAMDHTPHHRVGYPFPAARERRAHEPARPERGAGENPAGAVPVEDAPRNRFEGRSLTRPEEDLEDQGLSFDIATAVTRRGALGVLGGGAVAAVLTACTAGEATSSGASDGGGASGGTSASSLTEMPGETAGPYPGTAPTARTCSRPAAWSAATSPPASTPTPPPTACRSRSP